MAPLVAAQAGAGLFQTAKGVIDSIDAKKRQRNLLSQRTAYRTPAEINQILQATQQNASFGIDPNTMQFLDNKTNATFSATGDIVQRLGGDANLMSTIFGQKVDAMGNIAQMDNEARMRKFSAVMEALSTVAANKTAEWKSEQDIIKDKLQAAGADLNTANQNISGGINQVTGAVASQMAMDLYGKKKQDNPESLVVDNTPQGIHSSYKRGYMV